jgi:hypothetical protein
MRDIEHADHVVRSHENRKRVAPPLHIFRNGFCTIMNRYREDATGKLMSERIHSRHLDLAGLAPGPPEVDHKPMPTIRRKLDRLPIGPLEYEVGKSRSPRELHRIPIALKGLSRVISFEERFNRAHQIPVEARSFAQHN